MPLDGQIRYDNHHVPLRNSDMQIFLSYRIIDYGDVFAVRRKAGEGKQAHRCNAVESGRAL